MLPLSVFVQDGPELLGRMADRGAFDQYAQYRPGHIVVDDGVVYLNIAAIGAAPTLEDTFERRDQAGWGQSSHGEVWQSSSGFAGTGVPSIGNFTGQRFDVAEDQQDGLLLGPTHAGGNAELMARFALSDPGAGESSGFTFALSADEQDLNEQSLQVGINTDGVLTLRLYSQVAPGEGLTADATVPDVTAAGVPLWLRLRRVAQVLTARLWRDGTPEPAAAQVTLDAAADMVPGHVVVYWGLHSVDVDLTVAYLSLRPLTAATAPGDDADHWVALADALQVPQPV